MGCCQDVQRGDGSEYCAIPIAEWNRLNVDRANRALTAQLSSGTSTYSDTNGTVVRIGTKPADWKAVTAGTKLGMPIIRKVSNRLQMRSWSASNDHLCTQSIGATGRNPLPLQSFRRSAKRSATGGMAPAASCDATAAVFTYDTPGSRLTRAKIDRQKGIAIVAPLDPADRGRGR
jgi:hypothetical protein